MMHQTMFIVPRQKDMKNPSYQQITGWFFQEMFVNQLKVLVSKKQLIELTITEGWYSEGEMKDDLSWPQYRSQE